MMFYGVEFFFVFVDLVELFFDFVFCVFNVVIKFVVLVWCLKSYEFIVNVAVAGNLSSLSSVFFESDKNIEVFGVLMRVNV